MILGERVRFGEKSCGQGYGREAVGLMLPHGFNNLNLNRTDLRADETNQRVIWAYKRASFAHEGHMRQARFQEGGYIDIDVLLMAVLRSEWQESVEP